MATMPVKQISFEIFNRAKSDDTARKCSAVISQCRREGVLIHGDFYYQTPDSLCFQTSSFSYIVEDRNNQETKEDNALEEL